MKLSKRLPLFGAIALAAQAFVLTACSGNMDELEQYIDEVKSRPGGTIEPIPTPRPEPHFTYEADDRRSPFMPDEPTRVAVAARGGVAPPDPNRPREHLEQFPLDTLRMIGNIQVGGQMIGLVEDSDGIVNQVVAGNFIGQNNGRIVSITESEIDLVEIVFDGQGGYTERPTKISLSD